MDDADVASDKSQKLNDDLINSIRRNANNVLRHNKLCYYCDMDVEIPKVFCNADCRNDYDKEQKLKARRGFLSY